MAKNKYDEEGVIYVTNVGKGIYTEPEINASKLQKYVDNVYGAAVCQNIRRLIFSDAPIVTVYDENRNEDEELTKKLRSMCENPQVRLGMKMQNSFDGCFWYGATFFNPVWAKEGNTFVLKKLRKLPSDSFAKAPPVRDFDARGEILNGVLYKDGEFQYWQTNSTYGNPVRLENVYMVKDPHSDDVAGKPMALPIVPILDIMGFSWDAQIQSVYRVGTPPLFIRVENPMPGMDGAPSDVEWAQEILNNWGKDKGYQLRSNMSIIGAEIHESSVTQDTIKMLQNVIVDFSSPAAMISRDGQMFLGSSDAQLKITQLYISSIKTWIEDAFEQMLSPWLEYNAYTNYHIEIDVPLLNIEDMELKVRQAEVGYSTKSLTISEIRKRLGEAETTDEILEELQRSFANVPETPVEFGHKQGRQEYVSPPAGVQKEIVEGIHDAYDTYFNSLMKVVDES